MRRRKKQKQTVWLPLNYIYAGMLAAIDVSEQAPVKILQDTGCNHSVVIRGVHLLVEQSLTGDLVILKGIGGEEVTRICRLKLSYIGWVKLVDSESRVVLCDETFESAILGKSDVLAQPPTLPRSLGSFWRMTAGLCIGVLGTGAQVYIVEISHESIRGSLTTITDLFVGIGLLLTYGLGALGLGWRWSAFIIGFTTVVPLATGLIFFPDSPRWLAMKGRMEDARKALQFLRGKEYDVTSEFETIQKVCSNRTYVTTMEQISMLKNPAVYAPFLTSCGVFTFSQFSGPYVVYSYTVYIFEVANVGFSPYISTVVVGVARLIGSFIGIVIVEKAGRRIPLIVGGIGLSLSLMVLGTYFYLKSNNPEGASSLGWLPLTSMIIYTVTLGATISPIPFLLSTELQPLSFRSMGSSASKGVFFVSGMLITYSFPTLKTSLGPALTFWLYSVAALLLVVLVGLIVPETKGRTLEEIEDYYNRNAAK
ncbi:facilitated trehalose transporter Tret1-2 homolog [Palaemon carinicauda]|uniref:facilitated trehalose transporter Tret1-2 homolog n=1 Tax=Palaemon carinicauda TaxID=392227 RepID=UPI0035B602AD